MKPGDLVLITNTMLNPDDPKFGVLLEPYLGSARVGSRWKVIWNGEVIIWFERDLDVVSDVQGR